LYEADLAIRPLALRGSKHLTWVLVNMWYFTYRVYVHREVCIYAHIDCTLRPGGHCARESTRTARPGATRTYTQTHRRNTGRSRSADNVRQELQSGGIKRGEYRETAYCRLDRHRIAEQTFSQLIGWINNF